MSFFNFDNQNIFYSIIGEGEPLLLLHGNSVSSKMFRYEIEYFSSNYKVIVFDYPGHGESGRLVEFRDDFWNYNAKCALELLSKLDIKHCNVIGTSGGALVGLNLAILEPNLVNKLIADSFLGETLSIDVAQEIVSKRTYAKTNGFMEQQFWKFMHGDDWEQVVENDLNLMMKVALKKLPLIWGDLSTIKAEVLGIASKEDELIPNIDKRLISICKKIPNCKSKIYAFGKHPFMITQKQIFRKLAFDFFLNKL
jgi:pimeloyl-ACP methyl ester carboxylesterase